MSLRKVFLNACKIGNAEEVKSLLSYLREADIRSKDNYAFRYSCKNGHIAIVELLLSFFRESFISSQSSAFRGACRNC